MPETPRPNRPTRRRIAGQRRRPTDPTTPDDSSPAITDPDDSALATPEPDESALATTEADDSARQTAEADEPALAITEADDSAPTDGDEPDGKDRGEGLGRGPRVLAGVLAVLVVLTLGVGVFLGQKAWQGRNAEQARAEASAAARKAAELVLSYDYRQLDKSFGAARATLTPEFANDFDKTAKVVGEQATKTKATVKAEVREVAVRDGDADRVTLLVFVNQTTTSTITQGKPRIDLNRARFTMIRSGDEWQVQQIEGL
jgi:Mce-associated membrane protein